MARSTSGFSLVETLLVVLLLSILLTVALSSLGRSASRVGPKAAALTLEEELRLARETARATGAPAGVAFPTEGGTRRAASAYYRLSGPVHPRAGQATRLEPRVLVYLGTLDGETPPPARLDFGTWAPPEPEDVILAFTPDGALVTNWPEGFLGGSFRLVVSHSLSLSGDKLDGVCEPYTLSLSPEGSIARETGLPPGLSVRILDRPPAPPPAGDRIPLPPAGNSIPRIAGMATLPELRGALPGVDCVVGPERTVTVTVEAEDDDGDALVCEWRSERVEAGDGDAGSFSLEGARPMRWDPEAGRWLSRVEWRAPRGASDGDRFKLIGVVSDGRGGTDSTDRWVAHGGVVQVFEGTLAVVAYAPDRRLIQMTPDGSGPYSFTIAGPGIHSPSWSPDCQHIAVSVETDLLVFSPAGDELARLPWSADRAQSVLVDVDWSPDMDYLVGDEWKAGWNFNVYRVRGDGQRVRLTNDLGSRPARARWGPPGIMYFAWRPGTGREEPFFLAGEEVRAATGPIPAAPMLPDGWRAGCDVVGGDWSPDGGRVVLLLEEAPGGPWKLYGAVVKDDGTLEPPQELSPTLFQPASGQHRIPSWSPDGQRVVYGQWGAGNKTEIFVVEQGRERLIAAPGSAPTSAVWNRR